MDEANLPGDLRPLGIVSGLLDEDTSAAVVEKQKESSGSRNAKSWVVVAEDKKSLKKYEVEVSTQDGKHKVMIPDEVLVDSTPLWDDFVIGRFLYLAPHMAKVHMVVNKIWKYGELDSKVDVYDEDATTMRFRILNLKAREKILKRGMWIIAGVPMVVTKWIPKTEEEKQEETSIPMWIHLKKVPLHMYSWQGISFMTSTVGFPDRLHPETIACTNLEVAKVFVNVDVSKTLPKEVDFTKDGKEFTVEFHYPWFPSKCNLCGKWGHTDKICVKNGKDKRRENEEADVQGGSGEKTKVDVKENNEDIQGGGEEEREKEVVEKNEEVGKKDIGGSAWSLVSPTKVGRTQSPKQAPDIQVSTSKFSVLSMDEAEEMEEGEIQLEEVGEKDETEEDILEVDDDIKVSEADHLEDTILAQQSRSKEKVMPQKGVRNAQKTKAPDVNPKGKRSSRRKY